jgi:COMM domain containing 5
MNNFKTLINKDLKPYSKYIPEINKPTMRSLFKCKFSILHENYFLLTFLIFSVCVAFLENQKYSREAYDKEVAKLISNNPEGPKNYEIYITILMTLIETFLRSRRPGEDITEVLRELKFQDECVEDLAKVLTANQESLAENLHEMNHQNPLENFEYRINLSLVEK